MQKQHDKTLVLSGISTENLRNNLLTQLAPANMAITANWNQPNPILSTTSSTVYTPSDVPVENTDKHVVVLIPVNI